MAIAPVLIAALVSAASATQPLMISQPFLAGSTNPTSGSTGWALVSHGVAEKLFTVDPTGHVVPQVAQSCRRIDTLTWEITLKCNYKFSDGTAVTATNVASALTTGNQLNSNAQASLGTGIVVTPDAANPLKFTIASTQATPVMDAVLAEFAFTVFLETGGSYIFTGPYKVSNLIVDDRIELVPNTYYPRASQRGALTIKLYSDGQTAADDLQAGTLDMAFHIPVGTLAPLRAASGITVKSYLSSYQYMMWYNMDRAPLDDLRVREAIDLAIDREALTQEVRAGDATRSVFPSNTPYYLQDGNVNGQRSAAETKLDEAGWALNASGTRVKNGVPLTLDIVAYPQRPALPAIAPVVAQSLQAMGIVTNVIITSGDNWNQLDAIMAADDYDVLFWAQNVLQAGDPQFILNSFFRTGSSWMSGLATSATSNIDSLIDELSTAEGESARVAASNAVQTAVQAQVPVSFVMTPDWHVGLNSRLSSYTPYGADYYVVNADFSIGAATGGSGYPSCAGPTSSGAERLKVTVLVLGSIVASALIF